MRSQQRAPSVTPYHASAVALLQRKPVEYDIATSFLACAWLSRASPPPPPQKRPAINCFAAFLAESRRLPAQLLTPHWIIAEGAQSSHESRGASRFHIEEKPALPRHADIQTLMMAGAR